MNSIPLVDKYRPTQLDQVVGQPKAVAQVRSVLNRGGFGGRGVWISGPTGTGKTTLARIIASQMAHTFCTVELVARSITPTELRSELATLRLGGFEPGGRVLIINEAHGLSRACIEILLDGLESLPAHACVIFTTTKQGEERLFDDQIDASPLMDRCMPISLTNQGLADAFAQRALEIARAENLDGQPLAQYKRLAQRCKNSMRAMLQEIDAGCMIGGAA